MAIKVEWDDRNKEFYVKIGSGGRRTARKTSVEMTAFLRSVTDSNFKWSRAAKKKVEEGK